MADKHKFHTEVPAQEKFVHEGSEPEKSTAKPFDYNTDRELEVPKPYSGSIGIGRRNNFVTEAAKRDDQKSDDEITGIGIVTKL